MKPNQSIKNVFIIKEYVGKGKKMKMLVRVYELDGTLIASAIHFQKQAAK